MSKKNQKELMERYTPAAEWLAHLPLGMRVDAIRDALCAAFDDGEHSEWLAHMRSTCREEGEK